MGRITFILGGARSGKSGFAQGLALRLSAAPANAVSANAVSAEAEAGAAGSGVTYLATATVEDEEMRLRVARHRQARPARWRTVEEPLRVARALSGEISGVVIVDCLTLLITNILLERGADRADSSPGLEELEQAVTREVEELLRQCRRIDAQVLLISNEVGMSVVPPTPLGRMFRDIAGRVNQRVAGEAEEVYFLLAGLARQLK
jgi:adenosylcobinamide kinase/adenosylcobinamide-phosphate guanylyltransferase